MERRLQILHVVPTYLPATRYGGPIYSVHGLCKALAGIGHEVHVFTTNVDGPGDSDVPLGRPLDLDGVQVWYFSSRTLRRLYFSPPMARALRRQVGGFDLVHLHSVFLWPTWAAARAARAAAVPYVLSPRGMLVGDLIQRKSRFLKTAWITSIERRNLERAAAVHVTSRIEARELERFGFQLHDVITIPNGIDAPASLASEVSEVAPDVAAVLRQRPLILFLGRINWKKGLDRLVQAVPHMPEGHIAIVGNDEEDYLPGLNKLVQESGLGDRVTVVPRWVQGAEKEALIAAATVFVLPSLSENFGNSVLEAMARGCPVVVSRAVGAGEVIEMAGAGLIFDGTEQHLAKTLSMLCENAALRQKMGAAGKREAQAHYLWPKIAGQMEGHYKKILSE